MLAPEDACRAPLLVLARRGHVVSCLVHSADQASPFVRSALLSHCRVSGRVRKAVMTGSFVVSVFQQNQACRMPAAQCLSPEDGCVHFLFLHVFGSLSF